MLVDDRERRAGLRVRQDDEAGVVQPPTVLRTPSS